MRSLQDKLALVTGAGSGIGRAIAERLAHEGARLHLVDIDGDAVGAAATQLRQAGHEIAVSIVDVSQRASLAELADRIQRSPGGLDILVNNAGIAWYGPLMRMSDQQWDNLLAINLEAPIWLTRRLLKTLLARPESHVINVASICGFVCGGRFAAYQVSKFGLVGFSEALRAEFYRQGLGVTAVCPGPVMTNLYAAAACGHADRQMPRPPDWLCTTPEKVAAATVRSIHRNRAVTLVGAAAHLLYYSKRLAPSVFYALHGIGRATTMRKKKAMVSTPAASTRSKAA